MERVDEEREYYLVHRSTPLRGPAQAAIGSNTIENNTASRLPIYTSSEWQSVISNLSVHYLAP